MQHFFYFSGKKISGAFDRSSKQKKDKAKWSQNNAQKQKKHIFNYVNNGSRYPHNDMTDSKKVQQHT